MTARAIALVDPAAFRAAQERCSFGEWAAAAFAWIEDQWRRSRDRRQLRSLPDHILKDIGISRFEIEYVTAPGHTPARGNRADRQGSS